MAAATVASPTSGSDVINQLILAETGRISSDLWSYQLGKSPWSNALPRGKFQLGKGARQRTVNMEIAMVGTTGRMTWSDHTHLGFSTAATGNSPPDISETRSGFPTSVVQASQTVRDFGLRKAAVESPRWDIMEAVLDWEFLDQFGQYYDRVKDAASRAWDYEQREAYFALCDNKWIIGTPESGTPTVTRADLGVVAPNAFATDATQGKRGMVQYSLAQLNMTGAAPANGLSTAHSTLNHGTLQIIKAELNLTHTTMDSGLRGSNGSVVYPLVCSPQQKFWAQREAGFRGDLRYGKPGSLLSKFGDEELLGFQYIEDAEVPRFTLALNGSAYDFTEVLPWSYQAGSVSTAVASATGTAGAPATITVTSTVGFVAGNAVRITVSSASDEEYQGDFTVLAVLTSTTMIISAPYTDTFDGNIYTNNNGQSRWVRNPSYQTAPYEMSFVLLPDVMEIQTVDFPTTLGQGSQFNNISPLGTFEWINIRDEDRNPDGTKGYFRGRFMYGARPKATRRGVAILHRVASPEMLSAPSFTVAGALPWWS